MKNYLLVLFAFLLLAGCDQSKKNQQDLLNEKTEELESVLKKMKIFGPDLTPRNVTIEVMLVTEVPKGTTDLKNYLQFYNNGDSVGSIIGRPDEFKTIVYGGRKVKWKGKKFEALKKPKIKLIKKEKGGDFLNWKGNDEPNSNDEIELEVKSKDSVSDKNDIKYSIEIDYDGIIDTIDPILRYHED